MLVDLDILDLLAPFHALVCGKKRFCAVRHVCDRGVRITLDVFLGRAGHSLAVFVDIGLFGDICGRFCAVTADVIYIFIIDKLVACQTADVIVTVFPHAVDVIIGVDKIFLSKLQVKGFECFKIFDVQIHLQLSSRRVIETFVKCDDGSDLALELRSVLGFKYSLCLICGDLHIALFREGLADLGQLDLKHSAAIRCAGGTRPRGGIVFLFHRVLKGMICKKVYRERGDICGRQAG